MTATRKAITLAQLFRFYKGLPHQIAAINELEADIRLNGYSSAMDRARPWFQTWSWSPYVPLSVPYFSQMDNATTAQDGPPLRHCASSSCAMLAAFWGVVPATPAGEADYIKRRGAYGDTTDPMAHVATLQSLGLVAEFRNNATEKHLQQELAAGRPIAVGWLHHGPVSAPSGGGHWTVVIGSTADGWIHHDPYGEANLVAGGYNSVLIGAGRQVNYSSKNWLPRWVPKGGDGWMISCRPR